MAETDVSALSLLLATVFVFGLWICSFTVFSPLFVSLFLFKSLRAKFFSSLFANVIAPVIPWFGDPSKKLFSTCEDFQHPAKPIRCLEIGVGDGANFAYYPKDCRLTLLDLNPNFESYLREKLKKFPHLNVEKFLIAPAEDMQGVKDETFDYVISTRCLCSVSDVSMVLKEIHRVLKPGGKFAFLDHVAFKSNTFVYWLQKWCTPVWKIYGNGCCMDRDISSMVKKTFGNVSAHTEYPKCIPVLLRAHVIGYATK